MRLPFSALLPWLHDSGACPEAVLARLLESDGGALSATYRQVWRWRQLGLNADQADSAARAVGAHPVEVWGNDYYRAPIGSSRKRLPLERWSYPEWEPGDRFCGRPLRYAWGQR